MRSWEFLVFFSLTFTPILTQECITPNGYRSECKLLSDCAPLVTYMERRPQLYMSISEKLYINLLLCYNDVEGQLYVCCAENDRFYHSNQTTGNLNMTTITTTTTTENTNRLNNSHPYLPDPLKFECGGVLLKNHIFGGSETDLGEYPWMALLQYENQISRKRSFSCGGSLIHRRFVLTAGHCLCGPIILRKGPLVNVRLGEHNINTEPDCYSIDDCVDSAIDVGIDYTATHPFFKIKYNGVNNDIGLIRLVRDIETTDFIQPICFPPDDMFSSAGENLVVSGWGNTETGSLSDVKRHLKVPVVDYKSCKSALGEIDVVDETQICAGGEIGQDSCNGDSGGPLMKLKNGIWYLEAIVSFGTASKCGTPDVPAIYTRVKAYRDWILYFFEFRNNLS